MSAFFGWSFSIVGALLVALGVLGALLGVYMWFDANNIEQELGLIRTGGFAPLDEVSQSLHQINEGDPIAGQMALGAGALLMIVGYGFRAIGRVIHPY
jgi:hypothetical protein